MPASRKQSRRKQRRSSRSQMPAGGAGLMRFFEDSSIGIKIGPISTVLISVALILIVISAHLGWLEWIFTPLSNASAAG